MGPKSSNVFPLAVIIALVALIAFFMVFFSRSFVTASSDPSIPADQLPATQQVVVGQRGDISGTLGR
jgi:hypothetical protein